MFQDWQMMIDLLEAGNFEQTAQLLQEFQLQSYVTDQAGNRRLIAAAYQVCQACLHHQRELEWHRTACQEPLVRAGELKRQLVFLLDEIAQTQPEAFVPWLKAMAATKSPVEMPRRTSPVGLLTWWRRLREALAALRGAGVAEKSLSISLADPLRLSPGAVSESLGDPPDVGDAPDSHQEGVPAPPTPTQVMEAATNPKKPAAQRFEDEISGAPCLAVYCLGVFRVFQDDQPIISWPSIKGKSIFKYLVAHRKYPVPKEVLMEQFWPEVHPDAARNSLNVSIYGLRQALRRTHPDYAHVLYQDECYLLNPDLRIWVDVEEFMECFRTSQILEQQGDLELAIREYRSAELLYQGEFYEEDRYEDWLVPQRQRLQDKFLNLLDHLSRIYLNRDDFTACVGVCQKMLAVDPCREEAYRRLMRCYCRQGQPYLALRQYHMCVDRLKEELDVSPSKSTEVLYQRVRKSRQI